MTITTLEEVNLYKYLGVNFITSSSENYSVDKRINGEWKSYFGLENNYKENILFLEKKKVLFDTLVTLVILYGCEVWGCNIYRETWRKIELNPEVFIIYNLKLK
jgi:hypothetical protein